MDDDRATYAGRYAPALSPAEALGLNVSDEIDRWMRRRNVNAGMLSVSRRTLARCLKARNVTIGSVADVADALDCDVLIRFRPRGHIWHNRSRADADAPMMIEKEPGTK